MAVIIKNSGKSDSGAKGTSMGDFLKALQKDHGEGVGSFGGKLVDATRIPTGLFPLDLALGGGLPRGTTSMIYGPESSGKTNLVLLAIAAHQRMWPDAINVFFDIEHSLDPTWAKRLGVNMDKLVVISPNYGEQLVDMAESALRTHDCGIVAIDSLAAILSTAESEKSAEANTYGGNSILIAKLVRKTTNAIMQASKAGRSPTLFYVNQIRSKIGIVYGNPESIPGGNAPKFQCNVILRVYGKNEMDTKISAVMPVKKLVKFIVAKRKCPMLSESGIFSMVTLPHKGLEIGQCDDFNTVSEYLKTFGQFEKDPKKGWLICGQHYDTIEPFKTKLYVDKVFGNEIRSSIIKRMLESGDLLPEGEKEEEEAA
jgi:recombination protein RecA